MSTKKYNEYMRNYLNEWRINNKDKIQTYNKKNRTKNPEKYKIKNRKYTKEFNLKNPEKRKEHLAKYYKKKFHCLFCNKLHLVRNKKRHLRSNKHKKNTLKFNKNLI